MKTNSQSRRKDTGHKRDHRVDSLAWQTIISITQRLGDRKLAALNRLVCITKKLFQKNLNNLNREWSNCAKWSMRLNRWVRLHKPPALCLLEISLCSRWLNKGQPGLRTAIKAVKSTIRLLPCCKHRCPVRQTHSWIQLRRKWGLCPKPRMIGIWSHKISRYLWRKISTV